MQDYGNLAALLSDSSKDSDKDDSYKGDADDMVAEDSRDEVFTAAAQEAFHALKDGDAKGFAEALKAALGAC